MRKVSERSLTKPIVIVLFYGSGTVFVRRCFYYSEKRLCLISQIAEPQSLAHVLLLNARSSITSVLLDQSLKVPCLPRAFWILMLTRV